MDRLPQRKSPRLPRYDYNQAGVYFVTFCTKARENLLARITSSECVGTHHDASVLTLTDIGQVVNRMVQVLPLRYPAIHLESYVIMPNHVHLLLRIVSEERTLREASLRKSAPKQRALLAKAIGYLKMNATKTVRCQYPFMVLWQERYHDHIVRNEADYLRIMQYIENNPEKWKEDCFYNEPGPAS